MYDSRRDEAKMEQRDFYQRCRTRIRKWVTSEEGKSSRWAEYILAAPDLFHLLCRLSTDKDVPTREKAKLAAAIAYFVSPFDLIPEGIVGPIGYADDIALAAYVLNGIVNRTDADVVRRHWAGDGDVLQSIQFILRAADEMVATGLWRKLKRLSRF